ncbi:hypothetical protein Cni_G06920 [Canna indica]|uniref:Uncharacterized protein n=1 Tax=Canna indica TaxID=4628 RepID=A0AAQ3K2T1_9LILI|nr:hypothetical protein Cni_G06920 [Canna indica]
MQRQSLGSPGPKPLVSGAAEGAAREEKRKTVDRAAGCATTAVNKENKPIHLIPVLIILCLLVLYLFSHELPLQDSQTFVDSALQLEAKGAMLVS